MREGEERLREKEIKSVCEREEERNYRILRKHVSVYIAGWIIFAHASQFSELPDELKFLSKTMNRNVYF